MLLVILIVILVLASGGRDTTYHQLPKVQRGSSSAFTPDETNVPDSVPSEAPAENWDAGAFMDSGDISDASGELDEAALADIADAFGQISDFDSADILGDPGAFEGFGAASSDLSGFTGAGT